MAAWQMPNAACDTQVHKLTNVEAQRIMAILEETYQKLALISKVPSAYMTESIHFGYQICLMKSVVN